MSGHAKNRVSTADRHHVVCGTHRRKVIKANGADLGVIKMDYDLFDSSKTATHVLSNRGLLNPAATKGK